MLDDLAPIKDDEEAVKSYGLAFGVEMCRRLLELGAPGSNSILSYPNDNPVSTYMTTLSHPT